MIHGALCAVKIVLDEISESIDRRKNEGEDNHTISRYTI